jgi:hypothetical protein
VIHLPQVSGRAPPFGQGGEPPHDVDAALCQLIELEGRAMIGEGRQQLRAQGQADTGEFCRGRLALKAGQGAA